MGRLGGFSGRETRRVAERLGWVMQRQAGDHMILKRPGTALDLTIPDHREIRPGTLRRCIRIMGLTVDEFLAIAKK